MSVRLVLDTVTPRLVNWPDKMKAAIEQEVRDWGIPVLSLAQSLCPVRTGFLRSTIAYDVRDLTAYLSASAPYAMFVELGTSRMSARPFLRPAVDAYQNLFELAVLRGVARAWNA